MVFFDTFLVILDLIIDPDFHFGVPRTLLRICEIVLTGVLGRCLIDSPSMVTLPLVKPANRATACSLGLNEPEAMGVGTPCTQALSIVGIGVRDRKLDSVTFSGTAEHGTEQEILLLFLQSSAIATRKINFPFC